jgi:Mn-dependent DtxR family transcriptional regulator
MAVTERVGPLKDISRALNIKYQTAKSIVRRYRQNGRVERKNRILKNHFGLARKKNNLMLPSPNQVLAAL